MNNFNTIYKYNLWLVGSGTGSIRINNKKYITFLTKFLKKHIKIRYISYIERHNNHEGINQFR